MYISDTQGKGAAGGEGNTASGGSVNEDGSGAGYGGSGKSDAPELNFDVPGGTPHVPVMREVVKYIDKPQRRITSITIFFDDGSFETFPGK